MTGRKVTMPNLPRVGLGKGAGTKAAVCGKPVVGKHGLCAKHLADRVRLGGVA